MQVRVIIIVLPIISSTRLGFGLALTLALSLRVNPNPNPNSERGVPVRYNELFKVQTQLVRSSLLLLTSSSVPPLADLLV